MFAIGNLIKDNRDNFKDDYGIIIGNAHGGFKVSWFTGSWKGRVSYIAELWMELIN